MFNFDHISLSVSDLDVSISFYGSLGFSEFKRWEADDHSIAIVLLKNIEETILELFCYKAHKRMPKSAKNLDTDLPVIGTKHFGLCVDNLDEAAATLLEVGVIKSQPIIKTGRLGRPYFFICDPDGILIAIIKKA